MELLRLSVLIPGILLGGSDLQPQSSNTGTRDLWFFLSTNSGDLSHEVGRIRAFLARHREIHFRPVLLVEKFAKIANAESDFVRTLKAFIPSLAISIMDAEGYSMARRLRISRVPAYALLDRNGKRAHVSYGAGTKLRELLKCKR